MDQQKGFNRAGKAVFGRKGSGFLTINFAKAGAEKNEI